MSGKIFKYSKMVTGEIMNGGVLIKYVRVCFDNSTFV